MNEGNRRHEEGLYYERKKGKELEKAEWIMKKESDMIKNKGWYKEK